MKVLVNIRNIDGKGWTKRIVKASDLKTCVAEVLQPSCGQPSWEDFRPSFTLDSNNICVFRKNGNEFEPIPDNPETLICTDHAFFAVEYFETVPTDMYRTMKVNQLQPSTYTHPDYLKEEGRWTCVSPLYCTEMKGREFDFPWHSVSEQENLVAHACFNATFSDASGHVHG
jgi:hypothetical protein